MTSPTNLVLPGSARVLSGDCRQHMRDGTIAPGSVQCVVSSPPYWGLRDYGIEGVLWADGWCGVYGNEPTYQQYLVHTVELFEDLRRILRPDGTIWWNVGDTFAPDGKWGGATGGKAVNELHGVNGTRDKRSTGLAQGNKLMMPHRVAIALQDAGWVVRMDNQWAKPSPMPESISGWAWQRCKVKVGREPVQQGGLNSWDMGEHSHGESGAYRGQEKTVAKWAECPGCPNCEATGGYVLRKGKWRCTNSHEVVLQITQPGNYFSDSFAAAEPAVYAASGRESKVRGEFDGKGCPTPGREPFRAVNDTRNPRSVWKIAAEPYKGAHFATYPTEIPYRCIIASTSAAGCCPTCRAPYAPVVEKVRKPTRPGENTKVPGRNSRFFQERDPQHSGEFKEDRYALEVGNRDPQRHTTVTTASEYRPTCGCPVNSPPVPCTVYDPFGGSGTTVQVCAWTGREGICSEISEPYRSLIPNRLKTEPRCVRNKKAKGSGPRAKKKHKRQRDLFADDERLEVRG